MEIQEMTAAKAQPVIQDLAMSMNVLVLLVHGVNGQGVLKHVTKDSVQEQDHVKVGLNALKNLKN